MSWGEVGACMGGMGNDTALGDKNSLQERHQHTAGGKSRAQFDVPNSFHNDRPLPPHATDGAGDSRLRPAERLLRLYCSLLLLAPKHVSLSFL